MAPILLTFILTAGQLFELPEDALNDYLTRLNLSESDFQARVGEIALQCIGTSYFDGPLGEGPTGKFDTDPLIDLKRVDCVTYVEQTLAMAMAKTFDKAVANLQQIRYRDGDVTFEKRNHFFISDWIGNNSFCEDVTTILDVPTATATRTIDKNDFFNRVNAPTLAGSYAQQKIELHYVPRKNAAQAEPRLPSPALIVFIGKVDWLFALHCGLYIRDAAGAGRLYHASSKHQKVVAVQLDEYVNQSDRYLGFTAYKINEPTLQKKSPEPRE